MKYVYVRRVLSDSKPCLKNCVVDSFFSRMDKATQITEHTFDMHRLVFVKTKMETSTFYKVMDIEGNHIGWVDIDKREVE